MGFDEIIDDGTLVLGDGYLNVSSAIKDGKIVAILQDGCGVDGKKRIDAGGRYISPEGIDTHTHFFGPGAEHRGDWECGTKTATPDGYILVMRMPNSSPPVIDKDTLRTKYERASQHAVVDFALWSGAITGENSHIGGLCGLGYAAFKGFTLDTGPESKWPDHQQQKDAIGGVKKHGRISGFHAKDGNIISGSKEWFQDGPWNPRLHDMARPWYTEMTAIQNAVILLKVSGCPLHIYRLFIPEGAELIKKIKAEGMDVSTESCAYYSPLNHEDNFDTGTYGLTQPSLRNRERMEQMQEYLLDGTIDYLGADHASYTKEDKEPEDGNGWNVMGSAPSIDIVCLPMISEAVIKREAETSRLMDLCVTNVTEHFGLYPRKGAIGMGADADLALVDTDRRWNYSRKDSLPKTKHTSFSYEGKGVLCRMTETFVGGRAIYRDSAI